MFFHLLQSGFSSQTLTGPLKKFKKFQIVLCLLKLVLIFQLDIQDICQIQHNFKALQKANKFTKNYEIETFSKFSVFQEDAGFQNKGLCNTRCFEFLEHVIFRKVEIQNRKEIYNYRRNVLRCFFIATEKINAP